MHARNIDWTDSPSNFTASGNQLISKYLGSIGIFRVEDIMYRVPVTRRHQTCPDRPTFKHEPANLNTSIPHFRRSSLMQRKTRSSTAKHALSESATPAPAQPPTSTRRRGKDTQPTSLEQPPSQPPGPASMSLPPAQEAADNGSATPQARLALTPPRSPRVPESSPVDIGSSPPVPSTVHARPEIHLHTQGHTASKVRLLSC